MVGWSVGRWCRHAVVGERAIASTRALDDDDDDDDDDDNEWVRRSISQQHTHTHSQPTSQMLQTLRLIVFFDPVKL